MVKLYAIDEAQLAFLVRASTRLHSEERMDGDQMRDMGHGLRAIADVVVQLEIPAAPTPPSAGDVAFDLRMEQKTYKALRQALLVREMSGANAGIIEAFVARLVERVDAGATTHYFKAKKELD